MYIPWLRVVLTPNYILVNTYDNLVTHYTQEMAEKKHVKLVAQKYQAQDILKLSYTARFCYSRKKEALNFVYISCNVLLKFNVVKRLQENS